MRAQALFGGAWLPITLVELPRTRRRGRRVNGRFWQVHTVARGAASGDRWTFTVLDSFCNGCTFTVLRQNLLTFTLPPPYA